MLADKSAYNYYKDLMEKGYFTRIISGNINQRIEIDSIVCNFICADVNGKLITVMTTAATYEEIDDLLDLIEENIKLG